jgi:ribose transport system substrate-binding protein/inositol transport system substrate-binding protein
MKYMKLMRNIICGVVVLVMGGLGACRKNTEPSGKRQLTVGCSVYYMSEFVTLMCKGITQGARDLDVKLVLLDANRDPARQMSQVEGLISQKVDVLLVAPVHSASSLPVLDLAKNAGIPIVILNMELDTKEPYYFVGPNDVQAGELLMRDLAARMNHRGNIVILEGPIGLSAQFKRKQGIYSVLEEHPDIKVLAIKTANWNRDEAITTMENWLEAYRGQGIDAVVAENDEMAMGALQALESKGLKDKVFVGGVDGIKDACLRISEGRIESTIWQNAEEEGLLGIRVAHKLATGESIPHTNLIEMKVITKQDGSAQKLLDTLFK